VQYEPFGQRRKPSALATPAALLSTRSVGFTGHESDDEFGLINMRGRIYDPNTARFLTPDPFVQAPFFSQSLNQYTYVFNNPVNFVDPTGFQCAGAPNCIETGPDGGGSGTGGGNGGPIYECASWNPFSCFFNLRSGGAGAASSTQQQQPTRMDASRQGADVGAGWVGSETAAGQICSACHGGGGIYATPFDVSPPQEDPWPQQLHLAFKLGDVQQETENTGDNEDQTTLKRTAARLLSNPRFQDAALRTAVDAAVLTLSARALAYGATYTFFGKPLLFNLLAGENTYGRSGVGMTMALTRQNALYDDVIANTGYPKASPPIPHFPGFSNLFGAVLSSALESALEVGQQINGPAAGWPSGISW